MFDACVRMGITARARLIQTILRFCFWLLTLGTAMLGSSTVQAHEAQQVSPQVVVFTSRTMNTTFYITPENETSSGQPIPTWEASPACTTQPSPYNSVADYYGRRWGINGNSAASSQGTAGSCAFKDSSGNPIFSWETAPRCLTSPSVLTATADPQGRLWGVQTAFSYSCAFKAADSDRPLYDFLTAPACSAQPEPVTSESDSLGRLWGWELGRECAYKAVDNTPLKLPADSGNWTDVRPVSPEEMIARGAVLTAPSITWRASPACVSRPTKYNSVMDSRGRLWGWENKVSCAFKDTDGAPVYDWVTAPRCLGDVSEGSSIDAVGRLWGYEAGSSCAFKDLWQQPLSIWITAIRCPTAPSLEIAVPDTQGRLWGWLRHSNSSVGTSCAYRDEEGNALAFSMPTSTTSKSSASQLPPPVLDASIVAASMPPFPRSRSSETKSESIDHDSHRRMALGRMPALRKLMIRGSISKIFRNRMDAPTVATRLHVQNQPNRRHLVDSSSSYPACRNWPAPADARPDNYGRYWGTQDGQSCVYRDNSGKPATFWDIVPACTSAVSVQSTDGMKRSWGWENGRTCAFKSSSSSSASASSNDAWSTAPACTTNPTTSNSIPDSQGRLWGWEKWKSCAFKGSGGTFFPANVASSALASTTSMVIQSTSVRSNPLTQMTKLAPMNYATGDVRTAPGCKGTPSMEISQPDDVGYLWGWQDGRACVFRGSDGKVLYYAALITGDWSAQPGYIPKGMSKSGWFDAPRCSQPPTWDAKPDSEGRLWGYENGQGCVFRDARGYPFFYSDLQSGNVAEYYNKGSVWDNAAACSDSPSWSTARADNYGRLWGWDSTRGNSCAYKNTSGQSIFPTRSR